MRFASAARRDRGRAVTLGYCLNLHPAESLDDVRRALDVHVAPLAERLGGGAPFGVGMYLADGAARELCADEGALEGFAAYVAERGLDPFTYNAFPFGGFQEDGLKERVYAPDWRTDERLEYTVNVARVAARLFAERPAAEGARHVSISTHPGAYGASITDRSGLRRCAEQMARAVGELARIEAAGGPRIVLSLESEPDASSRNSRALAEFLMFARLMGGRVLQDEFGASLEDSGALMGRHLGTCLDCCHSAVEFEDPAETVALCTREWPLGKVQFSSALRLQAPGQDPAARERLLAMDEPRFLHQVTGMAGSEFMHLPDLPALAAELGSGSSSWLDADEWRCHFHVPVDRGEGTTGEHAGAVLAAALGSDAAFQASDELHVEIETYTWSVLEGGAAPDVAEGLAAEYEHVIERLGEAGWERAGD